MGGVADPKIHAPPHMRYDVKFGSSVTKGVCIHRSQTIYGALGPHPLPVRVIKSNLEGNPLGTLRPSCLAVGASVIS